MLQIIVIVPVQIIYLYHDVYDYNIVYVVVSVIILLFYP
jgi:hypothetical protein